MPFSLGDFDSIRIEKTSVEVEVSVSGGKIITAKLPEKIRDQLSQVESKSHGGDYSRQDSAVITAMLTAGHSPEDVYATFAASDRGKHAAERKEGHFEDYLTRTINKAAGYLSSNASENIKVDFARKRPVKLEGDGLIGVQAEEIEIEKVRWLWDPYIPLGKLTVLAGDPGMGKSTIALDIAARISQGTSLPAGDRSITGTCLIASGEDDPENVTIPRLIAAKANLEKIILLDELKIDGDEHFLTFPRDFDGLKQFIRDHGARLLIIDPLNNYLEKGTDVYKDQDIRSVLKPFNSIARETDCSILIVAHLNKKEEGNTLYRIGGSIGLVGAARSVLAVKRTDTEGLCVLYSEKSNLSKRPQALAYSVKGFRKERENEEQWKGESTIATSRIVWRGQTNFDPYKSTATPQGKVDNQAEKFLTDLLFDVRELDTDTIYAEGKKAGVSKASLNHTKIEMGITLKKRRDGKWTWTLPQSDL